MARFGLMARLPARPSARPACTRAPCNARPHRPVYPSTVRPVAIFTILLIYVDSCWHVFFTCVLCMLYVCVLHVQCHL